MSVRLVLLLSLTIGTIWLASAFASGESGAGPAGADPKAPPGAIYFGQITDTIQVLGQTVLEGDSTYEARVQFTTEASGRIFNEWTGFFEDKLLQGGRNYAAGYNFKELQRSGKGEPDLLQATGLGLSLEEWHHFAFVQDSSDREQRLYIDGLLVASENIEIPDEEEENADDLIDIGDGPGGPFIGSLYRDGQVRPSFIGFLDTLRVSDAARYSSSSFTPPDGDLETDSNTLLLFNFSQPDYFEENGQIRIEDVSGNGHTGTLGVGFSGSTEPTPGATEVHAVEFTQAIQTLEEIAVPQAEWEGGRPPVPIVAGKPAVMRVYFDEVTQTTKRRVEVTGEVTGSETLTLDTGCDAEKRRRQEGGCQSADFYFTPPDGDWEVTLNVYDGNEVREQYEFELTSVEADELALQAVSICDEISSPGFFPTWECENAGKLSALAQFLRKIAPTDDVSVSVGANILHRDAANYSNPKEWWGDVVQDVQNLHSWQDTAAQLFGQQRYYFGMIRPNGPGGLLGKASGIPGRGGAAKSQTTTLGRDDSHLTTAHEVGHMMGVQHTNVLDPDAGGSFPGCYSRAPSSTTDWQYTNNNLQSGPGPQGDIEVGFDVGEKKALPGDEFFELMGYCNPQWISPRTYLAMLNALGGSGAPRVSPAGLVQGPFWLVAGEIADLAEFRPLYEVETTGDEGSGNGAYRIEVRADDSGVLFTRSFTPIEISARPEPGEEDEPSFIFSELIPVQEGAARIVVIDDAEAEIGAIELAGDAPTVTITPNNGAGGADGVIGFSWSVDDPDSSEHTYWVDYSPDGGETWLSQGMGLTDTALGLDQQMLPGSDNAVVRVIASDGVNSGMALSAPFSVAKKLPEGEIIGPTLNVFRVGDLVWLEAAAWDVDDGTLDDSSVIWNSNLDGALGTGASLPVYDLSEGTHTLTMTAKDSDNNEVTDAIVVTVYDAPLVEGEVAVKGDNDCDGDVDSVDALKGLQHNAGIPIAQPNGCPPIGSGSAGAVFGDVDCDDDVDSVDSLSILRNVAGLAANLPPGCKPIGS